MTDTTTYTARAKPWAGGWELHIDGVGVTQAVALVEAEAMARDYIALSLTVDPSSFAVVVLTPEGAVLDLGKPDPADGGDELAEIMRDIDPVKLAQARAEQQAYQDKITAAELGRWSPELAELPDGTRLEFEYGTDVYAFWRDDEESALAGYTYGDGGCVWMEYGRTVPTTWAMMCATYGEDVLAAGRRLLVHPEDAHKRAGWPSQAHKREVLALTAERQRKALEMPEDDSNPLAE